MMAFTFTPLLVLSLALTHAEPPAGDDAAPPRPLHGPQMRPTGDQEWVRLFAQVVSEAHGVKAWRDHAAVRARITITAEGQPPHCCAVWLNTADGRVHVVPDNETEGDAPIIHEHALPYLLAAPFLLTEPGTRMRAGHLRVIENVRYETVSIVFTDREDDWLIVFADLQNHLVHVLAYSLPSDCDQAKRSAAVAFFSDFEMMEGVTLPRTWVIRRWTSDGPEGAPIARVEVREFALLKELPEGVFGVNDTSEE